MDRDQIAPPTSNPNLMTQAVMSRISKTEQKVDLVVIQILNLNIHVTLNKGIKAGNIKKDHQLHHSAMATMMSLVATITEATSADGKVRCSNQLITVHLKSLKAELVKKKATTVSQRIRTILRDLQLGKILEVTSRKEGIQNPDQPLKEETWVKTFISNLKTIAPFLIMKTQAL